MTAYIVLHTARTGSNWLSYLLAGTGVAGMASPLDCGLFIGSGEGLKSVYPRALYEYFTKMATPNDVVGCKTDWGYLDHLNENIAPGTSDQILNEFTHYIYLSRKDIYRQVVSLYFAHKTGIFTSQSTHPPKVPYDEIPYDFVQLKQRYDKIVTHQERWEDWFATKSNKNLYRLEYETLLRRPVTEIRSILGFLGVEAPTKISTNVELKRQDLPLKNEFAKRFKEDLGKNA